MAIVDLDKLVADVFGDSAPSFSCMGGELDIYWFDSGDQVVTFKQLSELSASLRTNEIEVTYKTGTYWSEYTGKDPDELHIRVTEIGAVPEWENPNYGQSGRLRLVGGSVVKAP